MGVPTWGISDTVRRKRLLIIGSPLIESPLKTGFTVSQSWFDGLNVTTRGAYHTGICVWTGDPRQIQNVVRFDRFAYDTRESPQWMTGGLAMDEMRWNQNVNFKLK